MRVVSVKQSPYQEAAKCHSTSGTQPARKDIMHSIKCTIKVLKVIVESIVYIFILGALIVYDITDLESWSKVNIWVKEL